MFVIDKRAVGPEGANDLVTGNELAGALEQQEEELAGLGVKLDAKALAAQLAGGDVKFEDAEAVSGWLDGRHCCSDFTPASCSSLDDDVV